MKHSQVSGFRFSGIASGIKSSGELDLGLIYAEEPVAAAGVFTKNVVRAAPVGIAASRLRKGRAQAIFVNSGNANACTGVQGKEATLTTTKSVAQSLGISPNLVLPASTGVIGVQLPLGRIESHAQGLVESLSVNGASRFAKAILTTDRWTKIAMTTFNVGRKKSTVVAIAKGAGMIHPNMATTLVFVLTDANVPASFLKKSLRDSTDLTFNRMSVDGDTSTNDSIIAMASAKVGSSEIVGQEGRAAKAFGSALTEVLNTVGERIVADGEGAERLVRICVRGATSENAAVKVARTIATSQLVKTALHGCDPNWGRILAAAGRAGVVFDPDRAEILVGDVCLFANGVPTMDAATEKRASKIMKRKSYEIHVSLGNGRGEAHYLTCDLGHEYVTINADYRS